MEPLHLELTAMYNLNRLLSKETNSQARMKILSSMKSLTYELMNSPYFTSEIVKQYPRCDWDLTLLVTSENFDYDLIYTLARNGKDWNTVLGYLIKRKDFSMRVIRAHPQLNWQDYGYLLVKVYDFTNDWKINHPEWNWNLQEETDLTERLNKINLSMDSSFTLRLPVPTQVIKPVKPPSNLPQKRRKIDVSPEREYLVLDTFKLDNSVQSSYTPIRIIEYSSSIENAPERKRLRRNSYEF